MRPDVITLGRHLLTLVAVTHALLFGAGIARADFADLLRATRPYVELGVTRDSNVFRVANDQASSPFAGTDVADTYGRLAAGIDGRIGRENIVLTYNAELFRQSYSQFDENNFTGGDADIILNWSPGDLWGFDFGYRFDRDMLDFANQLVPRFDVRERGRTVFQVGRRLSNRWKVDLAANFDQVRFDERAQLDLDRRIFLADITYESRLNNSYGIHVDLAEADYLFSSPSGRDLDFRNSRWGPFLDWRISRQFRIRTEIFAEQREYDTAKDLDYSGAVGQLILSLQSSRDTTLRLRLWRELSTLGDQIATYAVIDGISAEPVWKLAPRVQLSLLLSYEIRDFRGESFDDIIDSGLPSREDKVATVSVAASWDAFRNTRFSIEVGAEDRDSNRELRRYDMQYARLAVRFGFL